MTTETITTVQSTETVIPERVKVYLHGVELRLFKGDMRSLLSRTDCPIYWKLEDLVKITDNVWFLPHGVNRDDILRAAGHFPKKIDYAVPQSWSKLPHVKARWDSGDKPMWSYESDMFGTPLWMSEVYEDLKNAILSECPYIGD